MEKSPESREVSLWSGYENAPSTIALNKIHEVELTDSGLHYMIGWLISSLGDKGPEVVERAIASIRENDHADWYIKSDELDDDPITH